MFDAGVIIFFGVPCPEALAEVSVVHTVRTPLQRDLQVGDTLQVGSTTVSITQVGSIASSNLQQLGHVVVYTDGKDSEALPGAVHAVGKLPLPQIGDVIQIFAGA